MKTLTESEKRRLRTHKEILDECRETAIGIALLFIIGLPAVFVTLALISLFVFENFALAGILVVFAVFALCFITRSVYYPYHRT